MAIGQQLSYGSDDGVCLGQSATDKVGFFGLKGIEEIKEQIAKQIAVGSGGNVRAALLDAQSFLDAQMV